MQVPRLSGRVGPRNDLSEWTQDLRGILQFHRSCSSSAINEPSAFRT